MNKIFEYALVINSSLQGNLASQSAVAGRGLSKMAIEAKRLAKESEAVRTKIASLETQIASNKTLTEQISSLQRQGIGDATSLANSIQRLQSEYGRLDNAMKPYKAELEQIERLQRQNAKTQLMGNAKALRSKAMGSFSSAMVTAAGVYSSFSPLKGAISTAADYESALSKVQAITGSNAEEMERLRATASQLGASTMFSAKQSAEAMSYLGMAGWKTEQIIAGMPGLLDLAAASGSDLATVADIVSDDLTAFGMKAEQAGHMADVMAAASTNANTNVEMMGMTFKYAGAVAGALGYSLEDVSLATGLMANAGIKGEQAGTSLRAIMTRLVSPPSDAAKALDKLGISAKNVDGTMKPFRQTMQELREKFAGLSDAEKAELASSIAGQEAMSGFLSVVNASDADFAKLSNAVDNADGAAGKMAKTMQNNARGALTKLKSAMESIEIAIGSTVLPILASFASKIADIAGEFGKWAEAHPTITGIAVALAGLVGSAVIGVSVFGALADSLIAIKSAAAVFKASSISGMMGPLAGILAIGWPLVAVIGAIAAAAMLLYSNWDAVCEVAAVVSNKISAAWEQAKERLQPAFDTINGACERLVGLLGGAGEGSSVVSAALNTLGAVVVTVVEIALSGFALIIETLATVFDTAVTVFGNILDFVGNVFTGNWQGAWENIVNIFSSVFEGVWNIASNILGRITDKISSVASGLLGLGSGSGGGQDVSHNADGGIYRKGAFLTTFAEEGPEAAIPLDGSRRAVSLWQQAGQMLGMLPEGGSSPASEALAMAGGISGGNAGSSTSNQNVSISIPITINGSADSSMLGSIQDNVKEAVLRALEEIRHDESRVSFA